MKIDKSPAKDALSQDYIREMASAFQRSRVLLTAYELDLFTVLGEESKSSIEVAEALGTEKRATERLMNALCAIGFLKKNEGMFLNTSLSLPDIFCKMGGQEGFEPPTLGFGVRRSTN